VPGEADAQVALSHTGRRRVLERARVRLGPWRRALGEPPAQEVAEAAGGLAAGVEEALAVEVVAWRTAVVEAALLGLCARGGADEREGSDQMDDLSARQHCLLQRECEGDGSLRLDWSLNNHKEEIGVLRPWICLIMH
jgi:hypothetical protein